MDNEINSENAAVKAARPVKKVIIKRKTAPKAIVVENAAVESAASEPVATPVASEAPAAVVQSNDAPVEQPKSEPTEQSKAEQPVEQPALFEDQQGEAAPASKKKRGRKPNSQKKGEKKAEEKSEEKAAQADASAQPESSDVAQTGDVEQTNGAPAEQAAAAQGSENAQGTDQQNGEQQSNDQPRQDRQHNNRNNNNRNNGNNNNNNNRNGKFNKQEQRDQRNNQKKAPLTMEDISIPEEEFAAHKQNRLIVSDLSLLSMDRLKDMLSEMTGNNIDDYAEYKKQEVIVDIIRTYSQNGGVIYATGTLEILSEGYGFLRSPLNSYLSGPEDVYVSPAIIKFLNLKTGDTIEGMIRNPKENERFFAINKIATVNGDAPIVAKTRVSFDSLIPLYPDQRINLETERKDNDVSMRIINLFCPIGKGQRALITAPPRTGKTILLQQIANAITENHPEIKLIVLLVDERPEEVTDMRRNVKGEVIASTFDEQATRHVSVAEMVIEKAKRLVEHKQDVVILLDSITRLARAYNQTVPASGKILSGGVDSNALHKPKRFFGAARNIENGGSLTIIASALIETGSRMDEVIFEEFKGTGNSEIVLDRRMADRRLYPAINIKKSGTRREDLLLEKDEAARIWILRNAINGLEDLEMTEFLIDKMRKTKNNEAFLRSMNTGTTPAF